jgi:hypothetical protein
VERGERREEAGGGGRGQNAGGRGRTQKEKATKAWYRQIAVYRDRRRIRTITFSKMARIFSSHTFSTFARIFSIWIVPRAFTIPCCMARAHELEN